MSECVEEEIPLDIFVDEAWLLVCICILIFGGSTCQKKYVYRIAKKVPIGTIENMQVPHQPPSSYKTPNGTHVALIANDQATIVLPKGASCRLALGQFLSSRGCVASGHVDLSWKRLFTASDVAQVLNFSSSCDEGQITVAPSLGVSVIVPITPESKGVYITANCYCFSSSEVSIKSEAVMKKWTDFWKLFKGEGFFQVKLEGLRGMAMLQSASDILIYNISPTKKDTFVVANDRILYFDASLKYEISGLGQNAGDKLQVGRYFMVVFTGGSGRVGIKHRFSDRGIARATMENTRATMENTNQIMSRLHGSNMADAATLSGFVADM